MPSFGNVSALPTPRRMLKKRFPKKMFWYCEMREKKRIQTLQILFFVRLSIKMHRKPKILILYQVVGLFTNKRKGSTTIAHHVGHVLANILGSLFWTDSDVSTGTIKILIVHLSFFAVPSATTVNYYLGYRFLAQPTSAPVEISRIAALVSYVVLWSGVMIWHLHYLTTVRWIQGLAFFDFVVMGLLIIWGADDIKLIRYH